MTFNSYSFVIFFAIVSIAYYTLPWWRSRKILLLIAGYLFYAAWNPVFLLLLWFSTIVDWFFAFKLHDTKRVIIRRTIFIGSISLNLSLLAFFKYGNFLLDNLVVLFHNFHIEYKPGHLDIILPLGISFYTFETISYMIDVYTKKIEPCNSLLDYALFISFFPHLVAGPIVRARDFLPQCKQPKIFNLDNFGIGLSLLTLGLFQKVVIADALLAPLVDKLFHASGSPDFGSAWGGSLAFAGQIFCDFSGYSTCAIGVALSLGFKLSENFQYPYAAIGFSDFWRRWHISLSSWLRDYLYIPLGGNRKGNLRTQINLIITMLLGGLWHGAAWTFVIWGGLHGIYLVIERFLQKRTGHWKVWQNSLVQFLLGMLTFGLISITWVFFRAISFGQARGIVFAMLGLAPASAKMFLGKQDVFIALAIIVCIVSSHWVFRERRFLVSIRKLPWYVISPALALMLYFICTMPGEDRAFIYFQF